MNWLIDRLVMRIADVLDRSLITVPELDDDWARSNDLTHPENTRHPRHLSSSPADARP